MMGDFWNVMWEIYGKRVGKIMIYIYIWNICEIEDMGETFRGKKTGKTPG